LNALFLPSPKSYKFHSGIMFAIIFVHFHGV
jgi:hypothetical protein